MKKYSLTTKGNSRRTSRNRRLLVIAVVTLLLIGSIYLVPRAVGALASVVVIPVVHFEAWLRDSPSTLPAYLRDRNQLLEQLEDKDRQLAAESGNRVTLRRLQTENETLRTLLGATTSPRIVAGVVGRPPSTPYDVMVLDQGSTDGVVEGAPVYVGHDRVVGYINAVYPATSVATLVTTPGHESTVYILGPNIYTTAVGMGGGVLRVGVPQGVPLSTGDLVVVPSFDAGVFGEVATIDQLATRPEQYAFVTNTTATQSIRWVSIGREPLEPKSFEAARAVVDRVRTDLTTVPVPQGVLVEIPSATSTEATTTASTTP